MSEEEKDAEVARLKAEVNTLENERCPNRWRACEMAVNWLAGDRANSPYWELKNALERSK